jgi:hypothetical protein
VLEGSIINIGNESSPPIALHMIVKNGVTGELLFTKTKVPTPDGLSPEQSTRFEIPFTSDEVRFYVPENSQKFSKIVSTHPVFTIDVYSILFTAARWSSITTRTIVGITTAVYRL